MIDHTAHPHLLTDGVVTLRIWAAGDAQWYADTATGDELIQRFTAESPTVTVEEVRVAIENLMAGKQSVAGFLISDAVSAERLGNIALDVEDHIGDMSYWLAAHARGKGFATRALKLMSAWACATIRIDELRLWAHVDNTGSRAVAERAGYRRDPQRDAVKQIKGQTWQTVAYAKQVAS